MSEPPGCVPDWTSLIVRHTVHLKTLSSMGQRTSEPHVIQFPVAKFLFAPPAALIPPRCCGLPCCFGIRPSWSVESESSGLSPTGSRFFFLLENKDGNGWLIERECCGRAGRVAAPLPCDADFETDGRGWISESEELESPCSCEASRSLKLGSRLIPSRVTALLEPRGCDWKP